jgi:pimeloyl-ACP methyl ester carboxylesterase
MYYEIHGTGQPLVLLHGAISAIGSSFGKLLPLMARTRRVIAVELQAHGRTADVDRPLTMEQMAEDTVALLRHLGIGQADLFGFSMGAGVALQTAIQHPEVVRKLVVASLTYSPEGFHPELLDGIESMKPEDLAGSPFQEEYARIAPHPEDWPKLLEKNRRLDLEFQGWPAEAVRAVKAPTLIVIGDSDIVRPEHAVEIFRMLGGGVMGDVAGLPRSQLAVLPGTSHIGLVDRAGWLASMVSEFLDAPVPQAG